MSEKLLFFIDPEAAANGASFEAPREGDAGFDIRAAEALVLEPGQQHAVSTGLRFAIPLGWVGIIKDRSSVALKGVYTHGGVIDAGYRGELKILISNRSNEPFEIALNQKIAQMLVVPVCTAAEQVGSPDQLGTTERGHCGFGSTGKH